MLGVIQWGLLFLGCRVGGYCQFGGILGLGVFLGMFGVIEWGLLLGLGCRVGGSVNQLFWDVFWVVQGVLGYIGVIQWGVSVWGDFWIVRGVLGLIGVFQ